MILFSSTRPLANRLALCLFALPISTLANTSAIFYLQPQKHKFELKASGYCSGTITGAFQLMPSNFADLAISSNTPSDSIFNIELGFVTPQNAAIIYNIPIQGALNVSAKNGVFTAKNKTNSILTINSGVSLGMMNAAFSCKGGETFSNAVHTATAVPSSATVSISGSGNNYKYSITAKQKYTYTVKPQCTEQGLLQNNLANINNANYSYKCKSSGKVTISTIGISKGSSTVP